MGTKKAMEIENKLWDVSLGNQIRRLSKTLGFELDNGVPEGSGLPYWHYP